MLKFINKNLIFQCFLLFFLFGIACYFMVMNAKFMPPMDAAPLYSWFFQLLNGKVFPTSVMMITILLVELFLLYFYFTKNQFSENETLVSLIFYLLFLICGGFLNEITPAFFTNLFILLIINLNSNYLSETIKSRVFLSGVLTGIASLIDPVSLVLLFFVIATLIVNRFNKSKEIVIAIIGLVILYLYFFSYYFFTDQLEIIKKLCTDFPYFIFLKSNIIPPVWQIVKTIIWLLVVLYALFTLKLQYDNKLIVMRKRLIAIHLLLIGIIVMMFLSSYQLPGMTLYLLIPTTLYFSILLQMNQRVLVHDIVITAFTIVLCI